MIRPSADLEVAGARARALLTTPTSHRASGPSLPRVAASPERDGRRTQVHPQNYSSDYNSFCPLRARSSSREAFERHVLPSE